MAIRIGGSELGVKDCDFTARGETAGDVVRDLVDHLRDEHDVGMPDADVILAHDAVDTAIVGTADPAHMLENLRLVKQGLPISKEAVKELQHRFDQHGRGWPQKG